jgi:hypothetical protein
MIWISIQLNAIPINWVSIIIQSIYNWISTNLNWIDLNWSSLTMVADFHNPTQEKKKSKVCSKANTKGGTFPFCLTIPYWSAYLLKNWLIMWNCQVGNH